MRKQGGGSHEAHSNNPFVVRSPSGIWGEDILPVTEWEAAEHRVVMPLFVARLVRMNPGILRWADIKFKQVREKHARDIAAIYTLDRHVANWQFLGIERTTGHYRLLFQDNADRWYAFTFGKDRNDSWNAISITGGSANHFLENRLRGMKEVQARKK